MKKSFLKRVTAAIVAVPVALTQTALFTSFAAGETSSADKAITVTDALKIDTNPAALIPAADVKTFSEFHASELDEKYAFVQESTWNQKLMNKINAHDGGHYNIDLTELADEVTGSRFRHDVVRGILNDKNTVATADIVDGKVTLTVNYDYDYADAIRQRLEEDLQASGVNMVVPANAVKKVDNVKGIIKVVVDTDELLENKIVNVTATVTDAAKGSTTVEGFDALKEYIDNNQAICLLAAATDGLEAAGEDAHAKAVVQSSVYCLDNNYKEMRDKIDNVDGKVNWKTATPAKDTDELLKRLDAHWEKAPNSLDSIENNRWYKRASKALDVILKQIDEKSESDTLSITMEDLMDVARNNAYDISATLVADATIYTGEGTVMFYVKDEDADLAAYKTFFEEKYGEELAAEKKAVNEVYSVKVVDAAAAANGLDRFAAGGGVNVFRVVYFDTKDLGETTTSASETTTTAATTTTGSETTTTSGDSNPVTGTTTSTSDTNKPGETTTTSTSDTKKQGESSETTTTKETGTGKETTTSSSETTTTNTNKETTTSQTTTTGDGGSTTSETTTTQTETNTKPDPHVPGEHDMEVNVDGGQKFFFAHDTRAIDMTKIVAEGAKSKEDDKAVDYSKFTLGAYGATMNGIEDYGKLSPADIYAKAKEQDQTYAALQFTLMYNGDAVTTGRVYNEAGEITKAGEPVHVTIYVGVKGDLNLDGKCDAKDATRSFVHTAQVGAGRAVPFSEFDDDMKAIAPANEIIAANFENFLIFLGDCNTESTDGEHQEEKIAVNAADGTLMLRYSTRFANYNAAAFWIADEGIVVKDAEGKPVLDADGNEVKSMPGILFAPYPAYSEEIARGTGVLVSE